MSGLEVVETFQAAEKKPQKAATPSCTSDTVFCMVCFNVGENTLIKGGKEAEVDWT